MFDCSKRLEYLKKIYYHASTFFLKTMEIMNIKGERAKRLQYTKVLALGFSIVLSRGYLGMYGPNMRHNMARVYPQIKRGRHAVEI